MSGPLRAIVLAGGRSSRLAGRHKPAILLGGVPIVARGIAALRLIGAEPLVVGEGDGVPDGIPVIREDPPFSGPLAAVAAGVWALEAKPGGVILLLGGDMPFVSPATLRGLAEGAQGARPALAVDPEGRAQSLCAAWPEELLRDRVAGLGDPVGRPLRLLYERVDPVMRAIGAREAMDIDTPDDLRVATAD